MGRFIVFPASICPFITNITEGNIGIMRGKGLIKFFAVLRGNIVIPVDKSKISACSAFDSCVSRIRKAPIFLMDDMDARILFLPTHHRAPHCHL